MIFRVSGLDFQRNIEVGFITEMITLVSVWEQGQATSRHFCKVAPCSQELFGMSELVLFKPILSLVV